jgi:hypothetical protein
VIAWRRRGGLDLYVILNVCGKDAAMNKPPHAHREPPPARPPLQYPATIVLPDGALVRCKLAVVSQAHAQLTMDAVRDLPDEFILILAASSAGPARRCRKEWQRGTLVAVKLLRKVVRQAAAVSASAAAVVLPSQPAPTPPAAPAAPAPHSTFTLDT